MIKNILKSIFFKLSYNLTLRRYANKFFVYFPNIKVKLVAIRDSSYSPSITQKTIYKSNFLKTIKQEIEQKAKQGNKI